MQKTTLSIQGMTCNHCVNHVENAVREIVGVKSVKVSLKKEQAVVTFDESLVDQTLLKKAVEKAGYKIKN